MKRQETMQSVDAHIVQRIRGSGRGSVFSPSDFLDLGSRDAVDQALSRLARKGTLRRLARGLYDYPKPHPVLGVVTPTPDAVAKALAGKHGIRLQPSGAYAANLLGLSDQVPARVELLTDGTNRTVKAGPMRIVLKRTTPRQMVLAGRPAGLVIQGLRSLGPEHLTPQRLAQLRRTLPAHERRILASSLALAPLWMHASLRALAAD